MKKTKHGFNSKRLKNQFLAFIGNPYTTMVFISIVILFIFVVIPLLKVVQTSLTLASQDVRRAGGQEGDITLYYWKYLFASHMSKAVLWTPLLHSLLISVVSCAIAVPLGSVLAWLVVRSDIPFKKALSLMIVIPYMIPAWCKSIAWLSVFRTQRMGYNGVLAGMGLNVPDWLAYGPVAIIAVLALHYYAYAYIIVSGTLRTVNSELEEMGQIQGASKLQIIKDITLPLVMPAIVSSVIMTASKALGTYGAPATLGGVVGYETMATRMYDMLSTSSKGTGYTMAIIMIAISSGCLLANQMLSSTRKSYATIGGKGTRSNVTSLGKARVPISILLIVFLFVALIMPLFILFAETFQKVPGNGFARSNLTLYYWIGKLEDAGLGDHYPGLFYNEEFLKALWNTVRLSLVSALITALCGQLFGYISTRGKGHFTSKLVEQLVFIPYLIPSIAFGAIYLAMFTKPVLGVSLYGSFTLLVLVSVIKHFPFASRAGSSNMIQINIELEEAATIAGAGFFRKIASVVIPLAKHGFVSGFLLVFVSIAKELDLIAILMTDKLRTLSALAFTYKDNAMPQPASAVSFIMVVFILLVYIVANKIFKTDISKSM